MEFLAVFCYFSGFKGQICTTFLYIQKCVHLPATSQRPLWPKSRIHYIIISIYQNRVDVELPGNLLFVYQNTNMQGLLKRYGDELTLLDATYKTTRYAIPLFLLVVKTNVDYQIAAVFVTETESRVAVEEALQYIRDWNPEWRPKTFMTDYSKVEIKALKNIFGIFYYLF